MLITFEVENFRSIKDRQVLSLERAGHGFESRLGIDGEQACGGMTPVAVLFGANASGKSNVIDALLLLRSLVGDSSDHDVGQPLPCQPFRLDRDSPDKPVSFCVRFSTVRREYEYALTLHNGIVLDETLYEYVRNVTRRSKRRLFARKRSAIADKPAITVSPKLAGAKKAIIEATRDNMLFLSKAAKENFAPLMDAYRWFVPAGRTVGSLDLFETDERFRQWILRLMGNADLGVSGIRIKPSNARPSERLVKALADDDDPAARSRIERELASRSRTPALTHRSMVDGAIVEEELPWRYESMGTKQLWEYAGLIYASLRDGTLLVVDEIHGLHPLLLREIITLFQLRHANPNGAQLLFTSHDTVLLGNWAGMGFTLDRDQIWFTEKNNDGATQLYALIEFSPRETDNVEKMYLQGRLGATPILGTLVQ